MKNRVLLSAVMAAALGGPDALTSIRPGAISDGPVFRVGRHGRSRTPGKANPPGTKLAKQMMKAHGLPWKGEVFHGGELTLARYNRNNPFPAKTYSEMLKRRGIQPQE